MLAASKLTQEAAAAAKCPTGQSRHDTESSSALRVPFECLASSFVRTCSWWRNTLFFTFVLTDESRMDTCVCVCRGRDGQNAYQTKRLWLRCPLEFSRSGISRALYFQKCSNLDLDYSWCTHDAQQKGYTYTFTYVFMAYSGLRA